MPATLFDSWATEFATHLQERDTAVPLKEAAIAGKLADWMACLTTAVVRCCEGLGWRACGKGHRLDVLPQAGQEYLGMDVMAFAGSPSVRWPLPLAAFELENSPSDDRVAYSLWKVLCLRVGLRVVFAYRPDWERSRELVSVLTKSVVGSLSVDERSAIAGQTVVAVGNRGEGATFPDGYFKFWMLDPNLGRFEKV